MPRTTPQRNAGPDGGSGKTTSGCMPVKGASDKLANHQDRTASMPHNPSGIRSQKKIFKYWQSSYCHSPLEETPVAAVLRELPTAHVESL